MNCKKAHQQIHLFAELTDGERDLLLGHINECEECRQLSESMKSMQNVISRVANISAAPFDPLLLTNRIMCEVNIPDHRPLSLMEWLLSYIEVRPVKLAMAGISVLLIFLFSIEQSQSALHLNQHAAELNSNFTVLNAKNFQDRLNSYKTLERTRLMKGCKGPFSMSSRNIACMREKNVRFKTL